MNIKAKMYALEMRNILGLGLLKPVPDIFSLLESIGIYVFKKPFLDTHISALYRKRKDVCLVVINSSRTLGHQIFSAAHELYHYQYNPEITNRICIVNSPDLKQEEIMADLFASHFLMPDDGVIEIAEKRKNRKGLLDITDVLFIQQYFGVSYKAIINKLQDLGYIKDPSIYLNVSITKLAKGLGYNTQIYQPTNDIYCSKTYVELVIDALKLEQISIRKAEEYLNAVNVRLSDVMEEQSVEKGDWMYD
ncbi:putative Zn peptidase [Thermoanaerobacter sp. YS13]|uniref:ImmA/IrrE family metallo-endopeptidase n=1 Tax=Thermoanaerobacter sp. YS13 TaxID=1511746 RepID=UPI000573451D|nr:ImmA/IrrE family metallo-endopeptidase [Thermoanaerobacter sp. YS13]KHO63257.1 putative Zn peptidase [Thermoanaerobacter sp. YS13]